jgi:hypothetical protein
MPSQFLFNDNVQEVVPFNAKFHFPDQAAVKILPKNGKSVCNPGGTPGIQNNINSVFSRCRILYGSNVLEDIQNFGI